MFNYQGPMLAGPYTVDSSWPIGELPVSSKCMDEPVAPRDSPTASTCSDGSWTQVITAVAAASDNANAQEAGDAESSQAGSATEEDLQAAATVLETPLVLRGVTVLTRFDKQPPFGPPLAVPDVHRDPPASSMQAVADATTTPQLASTPANIPTDSPETLPGSTATAAATPAPALDLTTAPSPSRHLAVQLSGDPVLHLAVSALHHHYQQRGDTQQQPPQAAIPSNPHLAALHRSHQWGTGPQAFAEQLLAVLSAELSPPEARSIAAQGVVLLATDKWCGPCLNVKRLVKALWARCQPAAALEMQSAAGGALWELVVCRPDAAPGLLQVAQACSVGMDHDSNSSPHLLRLLAHHIEVAAATSTAPTGDSTAPLQLPSCRFPGNGMTPAASLLHTQLRAIAALTHPAAGDWPGRSAAAAIQVPAAAVGDALKSLVLLAKLLLVQQEPAAASDTTSAAGVASLLPSCMQTLCSLVSSDAGVEALDTCISSGSSSILEGLLEVAAKLWAEPQLQQQLLAAVAHLTVARGSTLEAVVHLMTCRVRDLYTTLLGMVNTQSAIRLICLVLARVCETAAGLQLLTSDPTAFLAAAAALQAADADLAGPALKLLLRLSEEHGAGLLNLACLPVPLPELLGNVLEPLLGAATAPAAGSGAGYSQVLQFLSNMLLHQPPDLAGQFLSVLLTMGGTQYLVNCCASTDLPTTMYKLAVQLFNKVLTRLRQAGKPTRAICQAVVDLGAFRMWLELLEDVDGLATAAEADEVLLQAVVGVLSEYPDAAEQHGVRVVSLLALQLTETVWLRTRAMRELDIMVLKTASLDEKRMTRIDLCVQALPAVSSIAVGAELIAGEMLPSCGGRALCWLLASMMVNWERVRHACLTILQAAILGPGKDPLHPARPLVWNLITANTQLTASVQRKLVDTLSNVLAKSLVGGADDAAAAAAALLTFITVTEPSAVSSWMQLANGTQAECISVSGNERRRAHLVRTWTGFNKRQELLKGILAHTAAPSVCGQAAHAMLQQGFVWVFTGAVEVAGDVVAFSSAACETWKKAWQDPAQTSLWRYCTDKGYNGLAYLLGQLERQVEAVTTDATATSNAAWANLRRMLNLACIVAVCSPGCILATSASEQLPHPLDAALHLLSADPPPGYHAGATGRALPRWPGAQQLVRCQHLGLLLVRCLLAQASAQGSEADQQAERSMAIRALAHRAVKTPLVRGGWTTHRKAAVAELARGVLKELRVA